MKLIRYSTVLFLTFLRQWRVSWWQLTGTLQGTILRRQTSDGYFWRSRGLWWYYEGTGISLDRFCFGNHRANRSRLTGDGRQDLLEMCVTSNLNLCVLFSLFRVTSCTMKPKWRGWNGRFATIDHLGIFFSAGTFLSSKHLWSVSYSLYYRVKLGIVSLILLETSRVCQWKGPKPERGEC